MILANGLIAAQRQLLEPRPRPEHSGLNPVRAENLPVIADVALERLNGQHCAAASSAVAVAIGAVRACGVRPPS